VAVLKRRSAPLLLLAVGLAAADGAAPPMAAWKRAWWPSDDAWRRVPQVLRYNNETEPETLDPHKMSGVPESRIANALFEGLLSQHPATLAPVPGLAERWECSADGLRWTFYLRHGLTWSDGTPLTSATLRDSWLRLFDPATGAEQAELGWAICGASERLGGSTTAALGVNLPDAHTVVVDLRVPCPWFAQIMAYTAFAPVPMHAIAAHGDGWARREDLPASGPYRLTAWRPRQELVVERNPRYHDAAFVKLDRIHFLPIDDAGTAATLFREGAIHWQPSIPIGRLDELRALPDAYAVPYFGIYYYRFNVTKPPLDDPQVRQALSLAIDRAALTRDVTRAGQLPTSAFCPPLPGHAPRGGLDHDPAAARAALAASRYAGRLPPIEILYNTSESHKALAEAVSAQWRDTLGVQATARNMEWKSYLAAMRSLDYQVARSAWTGDYLDPDTFYGCFITDGGANRTGWSDPLFDAALADSRREQDPQRRERLFHELERRLLVDGCAIAPIYSYVSQGLLAEGVRGAALNIRDVRLWQYLWLEPTP
jgi:oligopeptide transport system substrate-binding protein